MLFAHTNNNFNNPKATFVLDPPTKQHLEECFKIHANQLMVLSGLSVASPRDRFVKSTGRQLAINRLAPRVAELETISIVGTKHVYNFGIKIPVGHKEYTVRYALTTIAESDKVNLISCEVYK